jgi:hypothetical protein
MKIHNIAKLIQRAAVAQAVIQQPKVEMELSIKFQRKLYAYMNILSRHKIIQTHNSNTNQCQQKPLKRNR